MLLVNALAGTGKTTTAMFGLGVQAPKGMILSSEQLAIVKRMRSYSWEKAAAMAFNVPIAKELKSRVPPGVEAATTNAFGYRAWLKHIDRKKIGVSQWKTANILKTISEEGYLKEEELRRYTPDISKIVSLLKCNLLDWSTANIEFLGEKYDVEVDEMVKMLVVQVMEESVTMEDEFDFDDQLFMPIWKNISFPKFDLIVIDECLPGWTPVMLDDGSSLPIDKIEVGMVVRSYDTKSRIGKACKVQAVQKLLNQKPLVKIKVKHNHRTNGNVKSNFVICTTDHKVWTTNRGWIAAGNILLGDTVIVETAAKTTQKGKITEAGRSKLAELRLGNTLGCGNVGGNAEHFNSVKGGNGRELSLAHTTLLAALGNCYESEYVVTTSHLTDDIASYAYHYKIDIADPVRKIAIEVDGPSHSRPAIKEQDSKKQELLENAGWTVHRFTNKQAIQSTADIVCLLEGNDCPKPATVVSVEPMSIPDNYVYDITVEDCHNFYANGILVHNCQDLNAAKQEMAFRSLKEGGNLIAIGDRHQCQPGDTKVTICHKLGDRWNPAKYSHKHLRDIKAGDCVVAFNGKERAYVSQAKVVQVAQRAYCGTLLSVTTEEGKTTRCTPNHRFLVKWIKDLPTELWCTYVMRKGDYYRVGWCQVFTVRGDFHLGMRSRLEDADAAWIVGIHATKAEASFNEQKLALLYGIPTVMFLETNGNYIYSQDNLDDFWSWTIGGLCLDASVILLFEELGLSKDTPFYVKGASRKKGRTTCFELEASNFRMLQEYVELPSTDNISSSRGKDFTKVASVTSEMYQGYVHSLKVDLYGTYVADGVCTHNSIYGFSGADAASMDTLADRMEKCGNFVELPLTVTRRCPKAVVVHANKYVPELKAHKDALEGEVRYTNQSGFVDELVAEVYGRMILCRTNAPLTGLAFKLLREDRACYIQGREIGQGLKKILVKTKEPLLVDAIPKGLAKIKARIEKLEKSHAVDTNKIEALKDQVLCIEYLAEDLITVEQFCNRIDILFQDETSNVNAHQLSTVHKAKGLERKHVCIYIPSTLPMTRKRKPGRTTPVAGDNQENNLAYVAYTRAQEILTFVVEDIKK